MRIASGRFRRSAGKRIRRASKETTKAPEKQCWRRLSCQAAMIAYCMQSEAINRSGLKSSSEVQEEDRGSENAILHSDANYLGRATCADALLVGCERSCCWDRGSRGIEGLRMSPRDEDSARELQKNSGAGGGTRRANTDGQSRPTEENGRRGMDVELEQNPECSPQRD